MVNATSGACSSHKGVNCAVGADWDGSVICNDGNKDSSVRYNDMIECATKSTCDALLYSSGCSSEDSYTNQENYCKQLQTANTRSGITNSPSEIKCLEDLKKCREEITQHQTNLKLYDTCIQDERNAKIKYYTDIVTAKYLTGKDKTCLDRYGQFGSYDQVSNKCVCKTGFILDKNSKCSLPLAALTCFYNSTEINGKCICNQGYKLDNKNSSCVVDQDFVKNYIFKMNQQKNIITTAATATTTTVVISKKVVYAISEKNNLNIREKSSQNSKIIGILKKKIKYEITDLSNKDWVKIKTNGKEGWVSKKLIIVK
jgi:hypothetical protein